MASFKAIIGWKRPRKKENNYCRTASFLPKILIVNARVWKEPLP